MLTLFMMLLGLISSHLLIKNWMIMYLSIFFSFIMFLFKNSNWLIYNNLSLFFGVDYINYVLIILSIWIMLLMIISSMNINLTNNFNHELMFMFILLLTFLLLSFLSLNLMLFYLMFEASLIPTLMLILGWGYQPERLQAGIYLLFYTLFLSMPFLLIIFKIYSLNGIINFIFENLITKKLFYLCLVMSFLVKMPLFFFHLWLPKAHVEAPVAGSMILAGILLKLGGYGLIRILNLINSLKIFSNMWFSISLLGGVISALVCLSQTDLKSLVAYSSIGHMSMVISGIFSFNWMGMSGSLIMMISHGLCSSGLFCGVNMIYEKLSSRSILLSKGLLNILPSFSLLWFLLCSCNMSAPPSLNFGAEVILYCSLFSWSMLLLLSLIIMSFLSGVYSIFLFSFSQHGLSLNKFSMNNFYSREFLLLFSHWLPLNLLIMWINLFLYL